MNSRGTVHTSALRPEGEDGKKKEKRKQASKLQDSADSRAVEVTQTYILFAQRVFLRVFLRFACAECNLA